MRISDELKQRLDENIVYLATSTEEGKPNIVPIGLVRRLFMARATITDPPTLFLDEPTTGLDPQARHALWDSILDLKERGKTIILTTHYLEEAEMLCDRVIIIDYGRVITEGTPDELRQIVGAENILTIKLENSVDPKLIEDIKDFPEVEDVIWHNRSLKVYLKEGRILEVIMKKIFENAGIVELDIKKASLEDVFLHLTGRELRE